VPQGHPARGLATPLHYAHRHTPNTNTGLPSGLDLDRNGQVVTAPETAGYGNDALGFGQYPGQYGMTVYSRFPILSVRSFQNLRWADMPGNLLQHDPSPEALNLARFYPPEAAQRLLLSSKNHVDLALCIRGQVLHFLVSHPTPPAFDGPEDRNGKRNHDEIRLWADYIAGADYLVDDQGRRGGLAPGARFVIAGDLNADPLDGDSFRGLVNGRPAAAIGQLLDHPLVNSRVVPLAPGGVDARDHPSNNGDANLRHRGDPSHDTADFNDAAPGNLRVDYVLPSANLQVLGAGIFWPADNDRAAPNTSGQVFDLVGHFRDQGLYANFPSSDHRAVWLDIQLPQRPAGPGQACQAPQASR
jgi:Endonuclease/Exonuclease/phosphatase family